MSSTGRVFFGITTVLLVRHGVDERLLPRVDLMAGSVTNTHTYFNVHTEMLLQIMRDYPALPDYRTLTCGEIRFFYEGLREELKRGTRSNG